MNVWKHPFCIALCLRAAACVLCVSAAAADDSSIPMPNWSESLRRTINYGTSVMYISGSFSDCEWGNYTLYIMCIPARSAKTARGRGHRPRPRAVRYGVRGARHILS